MSTYLKVLNYHLQTLLFVINQNTTLKPFYMWWSSWGASAWIFLKISGALLFKFVLYYSGQNDHHVHAAHSSFYPFCYFSGHTYWACLLMSSLLVFIYHFRLGSGVSFLRSDACSELMHPHSGYMVIIASRFVLGYWLNGVNMKILYVFLRKSPDWYN